MRVLRNSTLDSHERGPPQVLVDVELEDGRVGQIGVRNGDDATELAETFVRAFRLEQSFVGRLANVIQGKIRELLHSQSGDTESISSGLGLSPSKIFTPGKNPGELHYSLRHKGELCVL